MIGVISNDSEQSIVEEFFQLFKTIWEPYQKNKFYDVVICTTEKIPYIKTKLLLIFSSEKTQFDIDNHLEINPQETNTILDNNGTVIPVYGKCIFFSNNQNPLISYKVSEVPAGIKLINDDTVSLRLGYDLFTEILYALSNGQPTEYAQLPTVDIHIRLIRNWILEHGIILLEIPPVPKGYTFITCLTHDVDFVGIKQHGFGTTLWGFLYRATIGSLINYFRGRIPVQRLFKNLKAVIFLPFVHLGIAKDFWIQFERYLIIESGLGSTFFIVPFKNRAGRNLTGNAPSKRAVKYDIAEIEDYIKKIINSGAEIGLHGIDAWIDREQASKELERISKYNGEKKIGVRMHWLYFKNDSSKILEKAGFYYDSTYGYNETIGYLAGTVQAFCPPGTTKLLELSMHIQDTALFYPRRMDLNETEANKLVNKVLKNSLDYGGHLTINWHQRSLAPERLWDDYYNELLTKLKELNCWFACAKDVVGWFNKRRSVGFEKVEIKEKKIFVKLSGNIIDNFPGLLLRLHLPSNCAKKGNGVDNQSGTIIDYPIESDSEFELRLN